MIKFDISDYIKLLDYIEISDNPIRIISNYRILSDKLIFTRFFYFIIDIIEWQKKIRLKALFHIRRSLFLITGWHHNPHEFRDHYSMVHQLPIKIVSLIFLEYNEYNDELVEHWIVISEFVGVLTSTSDEKKAPP